MYTILEGKEHKTTVGSKSDDSILPSERWNIVSLHWNQSHYRHPSIQNSHHLHQCRRLGNKHGHCELTSHSLAGFTTKRSIRSKVTCPEKRGWTKFTRIQRGEFISEERRENGGRITQCWFQCTLMNWWVDWWWGSRVWSMMFAETGETPRIWI